MSACILKREGPPRTATGLRRAFVLLCVAAWVQACAATPAPPLATLIDREAEPSRRLRALGQVTLDEATVATLHGLIWDDRQPTELRIAAMERLIAHDPADFRAAVLRRLPGVDRWAFLSPLCERVADEGWTDMTPALIQSWARPSKEYADAARPERTALESLHPGVAVDQTLWQAVAFEPARVGASAWALLYRTTDRAGLVDQLQRQAGPSPLLADLQAGWRELRMLPRTREQVAWLMAWRDPVRRPLWNRAAATVASLTDEQRQGLALRHMRMLSQGESGDKPFPAREQMLQEWTQGRRWSVVDPVADASRPYVSGDFEQHAVRLSWADLCELRGWGVLFFSERNRDETLIYSLFDLADADLADTTSEHGGIIVLEGDRVLARAYAPMLRGNDHQYVPPLEMMEDMHTALAHFHFHAHSFDNRAYAGPGGGDLAFADRFGAACLVFTFIDRDTLNVDYYHEGGIVIDLGNIVRPRPRPRN